MLLAFSTGRVVAEASLVWEEVDTQWGAAEDAAQWQQEEPSPEEDGSVIQVGFRALPLPVFPRVRERIWLQL
jgi:hypothetical protein